MIRIRVQRDGGGAIATFRVEGHAGYARHGRDIVCAGVTALVDTAVLGLGKIAGLPHEARQGDGFTEVRLQAGTPAEQERAQVILETMLLGLKDIEKTYKQFIRVTEGG